MPARSTPSQRLQDAFLKEFADLQAEYEEQWQLLCLRAQGVHAERPQAFDEEWHKERRAALVAIRANLRQRRKLEEEADRKLLALSREIQKKYPSHVAGMPWADFAQNALERGVDLEVRARGWLHAMDLIRWPYLPGNVVRIARSLYWQWFWRGPGRRVRVHC